MNVYRCEHCGTLSNALVHCVKRDDGSVITFSLKLRLIEEDCKTRRQFPHPFSSVPDGDEPEAA